MLLYQTLFSHLSQSFATLPSHVGKQLCVKCTSVASSVDTSSSGVVHVLRARRSTCWLFSSYLSQRYGMTLCDVDCGVTIVNGFHMTSNNDDIRRQTIANDIQRRKMKSK
jgi:hypothetical protein